MAVELCQSHDSHVCQVIRKKFSAEIDLLPHVMLESEECITWHVARDCQMFGSWYRHEIWLYVTASIAAGLHGEGGCQRHRPRSWWSPHTSWFGP